MKNFVKKGKGIMKRRKRRKMSESQFPFPPTFCLQKKVKKKQNICAAMFVCLFCWTVCSYTRNNHLGRSGLKFDPVCQKYSGGGWELYSERLGKDF